MTDYTAPSADEIREYLKANNLKNPQAAKMAGVHPRTFRRYKSPTKPQVIPEERWHMLKDKVRKMMMEKSDD